jgi:RNA polymerase sigma-70 factor (ECF subfamily)
MSISTAKRGLQSITHMFTGANAIPWRLFQLSPIGGRAVLNQVQTAETSPADVAVEDTNVYDSLQFRPCDRKLPVSPDSDFDQIFARYADPVYRFLYSRVGNREDAEDLTSEVFLKASRQLNTQGPEARMAQRLFMIARTVLADHWRSYYHTGVVLPFDDQPIKGVGPCDSDSPSAAATQQVQDVLDAVPIFYRRVLELRFSRGYSIEEIAVEMHVTPETVRVMQHRALAEAVQASKDHQ